MIKKIVLILLVITCIGITIRHDNRYAQWHKTVKANSQQKAKMRGLEALQALFPLPYFPGYGDVPNIYIAMSKDPTLKTMMENFTKLSLEDALDGKSKIEEILLQWAGVREENQTASGKYIDGRIMRFFEKYAKKIYPDAIQKIDAPVFYDTWYFYVQYYHETILLQAQMANFFPDSTTPIDKNKIHYGDDITTIVKRFESSHHSAEIKEKVLPYLKSHASDFPDQIAFNIGIETIKQSIAQQKKVVTLQKSAKP